MLERLIRVNIVLMCVLSANQGKRKDQLSLAQAWNRVDIAKDQLFGPDTEWEVSTLSFLIHPASKKYYFFTKKVLSIFYQTAIPLPQMLLFSTQINIVDLHAI